MAKKEKQIGSLMDTKSREPVMSFIQPDAKDSLTIGLAGDWKIGEEIPSPDDADCRSRGIWRTSRESKKAKTMPPRTRRMIRNTMDTIGNNSRMAQS